MNKDFMMGAELALRGAGIQDDRVKQELMSKLTNAQLATHTAKLQNDQSEMARLQSFMQQAQGIQDPQQLGALAVQHGFIQPGLSAMAKETPDQTFERQKELANISAGNKTPNEIELIRKAQSGDKEAAATLAELQKRRIEASSASGAARAEGFGNIRQLMIIDPVTKQPRFANANEINEMNKSGVQPQPAQQNLEQITKVAEAKVPGSQRAASVRTAATVMKQEVPEIISLRGIVKSKNLLPTGGFKDLESVNQWVMAKASDPDTALLKKKVKMLADNLQRTIGGSQGGEWAFKVAADILDPSFDTPAFTRIVNSHTETLNRMANAYKNYGKDIDPKTEKAIAELVRRGKTVNEQTISQALKLIGE